MIEQLMSSSLVQVTDLIAFGFTEAEITAAGYHLPCHGDDHEEEEEEERDASAAAAAATVLKAAQAEEGSTDAHRERSRKRGWRDEPNTRATPPTPARVQASTASSAMSARSPRTQEPTTAAKTLDGAVPLSEQNRVEALRSARVVEEHLGRRHATAAPLNESCVANPDDCVRALHFDAEEEGEGGDRATAAKQTTTTTRLVSSPFTQAAAPVQHKSNINTALTFSGVDVAVAKEIALLLRAPADEDANAKQLSMQEYIESRVDGNTPYM